MNILKNATFLTLYFMHLRDCIIRSFADTIMTATGAADHRGSLDNRGSIIQDAICHAQQFMYGFLSNFIGWKSNRSQSRRDVSAKLAVIAATDGDIIRNTKTPLICSQHHIQSHTVVITQDGIRNTILTEIGKCLSCILHTKKGLKYILIRAGNVMICKCFFIKYITCIGRLGFCAAAKIADSCSVMYGNEMLCQICKGGIVVQNDIIGSMGFLIDDKNRTGAVLCDLFINGISESVFRVSSVCEDNTVKILIRRNCKNPLFSCKGVWGLAICRCKNLHKITIFFCCVQNALTQIVLIFTEKVGNEYTDFPGMIHSCLPDFYCFRLYGYILSTVFHIANIF